MSRHRIVKMLDLEDELDDFDGGEDYEYEEGVDGELGGEDKEQMRDGTIKVREALDPDILITDREIQDALWHYYYDVAKTVTWLLNQRTAAPPKKSKKERSEKKAAGEDSAIGKKSNDLNCRYPFPMVPLPCKDPFSVADFFKDTPWLNIPTSRRGEILIESLYPQGGLLGGSSSGGTAKVSKLAALAAARKKNKESKKLEKGDEPGLNRKIKQQSNSVALLGKLGSKGKENIQKTPNGQPLQGGSGKEGEIDEAPAQGLRLSNYPSRKQENENPVPGDREEAPAKSYPDEGLLPKPLVLQAPPSSFAMAMLGNPTMDHRPSPDDMVSNAQTQKGTKSGKSAPKQINGDKIASHVPNGVGPLSVEDSPRVKSKNLDVLAEYERSKGKNAANFITIGHVDAGKSTLMGRLLYDLKVVDERTLEKFRKEAENIGRSSFALAWVLDQTSEERNRGVTMDIATNNFETSKTRFTILDAPGHQDFIPNMIAGASQADFAVLVIDASTNSFESGLRGQTKEHALLVRSMGVQRLVVAINKLDTVQWSQDRFDEIQQQTSAFLTNAGFQPKNLTFVPCSGLTGGNIVYTPSSGTIPWYHGPTLIEQLENSEPITRALEKPMRLTIGDIFRGGIQNPLSVSGRIDAGDLQVGDQVVAMPSGEKANVKAVEVDQESRDWAVAGQNVVLHLTDIDPIHLKTGDVLCPPSSPIKTIKTFTTKILAFDHITPMHVDLHRGRLHAAGRITQLLSTIDKGSGAIIKKKPRLIQPGSVARVLMEMENAVSLEAPAKIVLRANGETVAAGLLE